MVEAIVKAVVAYLKKRERLDLLPLVASAFARLAARQADPNLAVVTSAVPLTGQEQQQLKAGLNRALGRPVGLRLVVDRQLIGGLRLNIDGRLIDLSLSQQLEDLGERLAYD